MEGPAVFDEPAQSVNKLREVSVLLKAPKAGDEDCVSGVEQHLEQDDVVGLEVLR